MGISLAMEPVFSLSLSLIYKYIYIYLSLLRYLLVVVWGGEGEESKGGKKVKDISTENKVTNLSSTRPLSVCFFASAAYCM